MLKSSKIDDLSVEDLAGHIMQKIIKNKKLNARSCSKNPLIMCVLM